MFLHSNVYTFYCLIGKKSQKWNYWLKSYKMNIFKDFKKKFLNYPQEDCIIYSSNSDVWKCLFCHTTGNFSALLTVQPVLCRGYLILFPDDYLYLFIFFGCTGSSLLYVGSLQLWLMGVALCCDAQASHCSGFFCWGARALRHAGSGVAACGLQGWWAQSGSVAVVPGLSCPVHVASSWVQG